MILKKLSWGAAESFPYSCKWLVRTSHWRNFYAIKLVNYGDLLTFDGAFYRLFQGSDWEGLERAFIRYIQSRYHLSVLPRLYRFLWAIWIELTSFVVLFSYIYLLKDFCILFAACKLLLVKTGCFCHFNWVFFINDLSFNFRDIVWKLQRYGRIWAHAFSAHYTGEKSGKELTEHGSSQWPLLFLIFSMISVSLMPRVATCLRLMWKWFTPQIKSTLFWKISGLWFRTCSLMLPTSTFKPCTCTIMC